MYGEAILLMALAAAAVHASVIPFSMSNLPEEYKEFVPEEVKDFYKDLSPEDKQVLRDLAGRQASFANEDAALEALKEKSPKLHTKAMALRNFLKGKIDSLKPEAKTFVEEIIAKARSLRPAEGQKPDLEKIKQTIRDVIDKYQALGQETKDELKTVFPHTAKIVASKFRIAVLELPYKKGQI
ncbi:unnamed protein product [Gongylonema pulchrum]|uniref:Fatty-acid and retinol-binding protein 1 n=1 Tax=Gongylonema pulchrum TaxID=637853 RepID=A0A183D414_9BILA|nr:unnamed protein product [Gongylonema pulchrum]